MSASIRSNGNAASILIQNLFTPNVRHPYQPRLKLRRFENVAERLQKVIYSVLPSAPPLVRSEDSTFRTSSLSIRRARIVILTRGSGTIDDRRFGFRNLFDRGLRVQAILKCRVNE
jgi:hypothetical protein